MNRRSLLLANNFHNWKSHSPPLAVIHFYERYEEDLSHIIRHNDSSYDVSVRHVSINCFSLLAFHVLHFLQSVLIFCRRSGTDLLYSYMNWKYSSRVQVPHNCKQDTWVNLLQYSSDALVFSAEYFHCMLLKYDPSLWIQPPSSTWGRNDCFKLIALLTLKSRLNPLGFF